MALSTLEIGRMTNSMEMDKRYGLIRQSMWESIEMERNMDRDTLNGKMAVHTKESLKTTTLREKDTIYGLTRESIKDSGHLIR